MIVKMYVPHAGSGNLEPPTLEFCILKIPRWIYHKANTEGDRAVDPSVLHAYQADRRVQEYVDRAAVGLVCV